MISIIRGVGRRPRARIPRHHGLVCLLSLHRYTYIYIYIVYIHIYRYIYIYIYIHICWSVLFSCVHVVVHGLVCLHVTVCRSSWFTCYVWLIVDSSSPRSVIVALWSVLVISNSVRLPHARIVSPPWP